MKEKKYAKFVAKAYLSLAKRRPVIGLFEVTYRCNLKCVHCYCKGSEKLEAELNTKEIKDILDQLYQEGCLEISFTGGEPLIREDFLEIYLYAKRKGFIIDIFTNATLFNKERIAFFQKYPPRAIEVTLNGITQDIYEAITQVTGSFQKAISNIYELSKRNMPLVLKVNCLKQNKNEIAKIKVFTEKLFGEDKKRFRFDSYISPRLNQDKTPCKYRLNPSEIKEVMQSEAEIYAEYKERLKSEHSLARDKRFLYQCNAWLTHFFINPYGRLKFCEFTENFSADLRTISFREGFYKLFPNLLKEKFRTDSPCKDCRLRVFCYHCPARAYLETRGEETPVPYFCALAKNEEFRAGELNKDPS